MLWNSKISEGEPYRIHENLLINNLLHISSLRLSLSKATEKKTFLFFQIDGKRG